ncbi:MAG: AAA family ATPase [Kofleriaceae bacterium]
MTADLVLHARIRWAAACLARLVELATREGWAEGHAPSEHLGDSARFVPDPDATASTFDLLRARLDLSAAQVDALWLLACVEIEPALARVLATVSMPGMPDMSLSVWQRLVESAGHRALTGERIDELAGINLIELTRDHRLPEYRRWVRASDRVVSLARGEHLELDRGVAHFATLVMPDEPTMSEIDVPQSIDQSLRSGGVIVAVGPEGSGRSTLLQCAARRQNRAVLRIRCSELASDAETLGRQVRSVAREARLFCAVPLLLDLDVLLDTSSERYPAVRELFRNFPNAVLATLRDEVPIQMGRPCLVHRIASLTGAERERIWNSHLPECDSDLLQRIATAYAVNPGGIAAAARNVRASLGEGAAITARDVHDGLRSHLAQQVGTIATRIRCDQTWDDLVMPVDQFDQLIELVARVRHRQTVLENWGFARKVGRGLGLAVLFSGPPGTGKTMAAGLVARELALDLYQVDLAKVVSKYIGETEKNLARVFDAAESGHAVLLFDEAESLFAKRSEVKSSNDRYANLEVNYLLQRIEQFRGISILTTNHESAIDDAFRRRLAIHVRFPVPDDDQRELLWRAMIPDEAPVAGDLQLGELARKFQMTGGYIRNAVMRAAYLAADAGGVIENDHLLRAAQHEYEAIGKVSFELS